MGKAFNTTLPTPLKIVLVAYADHANDDGSSVYPGEPWMVVKTSYSAGTIRRLTSELIDTGLLHQTHRGHRGQRAQYEINVDLLAHVQIGHKPKGAHPDTHYLLVDNAPHWVSDRSEWVSTNDEWVSDTELMGITSDTPNVIEPSENNQEKKSAHASENPEGDHWHLIHDGKCKRDDCTFEEDTA